MNAVAYIILVAMYTAIAICKHFSSDIGIYDFLLDGDSLYFYDRVFFDDRIFFDLAHQCNQNKQSGYT